MKAQWDEGGGRILLGDNTGRGAVMLLTIRFRWSASRPSRNLPPGKTWYPLYSMLGGPQVRSGQVRKISPPPGFDPQTVQPIGSRYTDYDTRLVPVFVIPANYCTWTAIIATHSIQLTD